MASQTHARGGRPPKYKPEYADQIIEFFASFADEPYTKEVVREERTYYESGQLKASKAEHKFVAKRLPTLFGFARKIDTTYTTVYRWAHERVGKKPEEGEKDTRPFKYPEFRKSYKLAVHFQTEYLTAVGLGGIAPANAFVFTAKNVIRWRDSVDQRFVDGDGKDRPAPGYVLLPARGGGDPKEDEDPELENPEEDNDD